MLNTCPSIITLGYLDTYFVIIAVILFSERQSPYLQCIIKKYNNATLLPELDWQQQLGSNVKKLLLTHSLEPPHRNMRKLK